MMYYASNGAQLNFDGTDLVGREFELKVNGQTVIDTCTSGGPAYSGYPYYYVAVDGVNSSVGAYFQREMPLPAQDVFELSYRNTCSVPLTLKGSATVTYSFEYHAQDSECSHDYYFDEQSVVFQ